MKHLCTWAVCYDIDGSQYDDHQPRTSVTAIFRDPHLAEDFIAKCLAGGGPQSVLRQAHGGGSAMSPAALILLTVGAATVAGWLFRIIDAIEHPNRRR